MGRIQKQTSKIRRMVIGAGRYLGTSRAPLNQNQPPMNSGVITEIHFAENFTCPYRCLFRRSMIPIAVWESIPIEKGTKCSSVNAPKTQRQWNSKTRRAIYSIHMAAFGGRRVSYSTGGWTCGVTRRYQRRANPAAVMQKDRGPMKIPSRGHRRTTKSTWRS